MNSCKIIAAVLEKGGVGKTTTTISLGAALVQHGMRVLLVDFDPQSSLTVSLGADFPDELPHNMAGIMAKAIEEKPYSVDEAILKTEGMDVLPSSIELSAIELSLMGVFSREHVLAGVLEPLREKYDYILIDCAPSLGMLTINALAAADSVIIPMQAQYLSAKGVELLMDIIFKMKRKINPDLEIEGILITMRDRRTKHGREMVNAIKDTYSQHIRVFEHEIPMSVKVAESSAKGVSIFAHDPSGFVAEAYENIAREVIGYAGPQEV